VVKEEEVRREQMKKASFLAKLNKFQASESLAKENKDTESLRYTNPGSAVCSILFYSNLFYSIILCSILFYSILHVFYSILFYYILFYSVLFCSILFYSVLFYSILFYSIIFFVAEGKPSCSSPWRSRRRRRRRRSTGRRTMSGNGPDSQRGSSLRRKSRLRWTGQR
jgi:hypothetical protein